MTGRFEICIKGRLDSGWSDRFGGLEISSDEQGETHLSGFISDQAALYGILNQLAALGLTLISVTPVRATEKEVNMDELQAKANVRVGATNAEPLTVPGKQDHPRENNTSAAAMLRELRQLKAHTAANRSLNGWMVGAYALALLRAAADSGILDALRTPSTPAQIATATQIDPQRVENTLLALDAYGVARRSGGLYEFSPDWARLAEPTAIQPLINVLCAATTKTRTLETIGQDGDIYTALPAEDMLAMAQGVGTSALSRVGHVQTVGLAHGMPELKAFWERGARHLEVGCGVGNSLFGIATTYPKVTAVGLEIQPLIAKETRRRANVLGVTDRVEVRQMDARDLLEEAAYDTAQWSQFFFPEPSRADVLRALTRAMKPGGYVFMPLLPEVPPKAAARRRQMLSLDLQSLRSNLFLAGAFLSDIVGDTRARRRAEERFAALQNLLYSQWGVPVRTVSELQSEMQDAGFQVVRTMPMPSSQFSESRGLLLARKPAADQDQSSR